MLVTEMASSTRIAGYSANTARWKVEHIRTGSGTTTRQSPPCGAFVSQTLARSRRFGIICPIRLVHVESLRFGRRCAQFCSIRSGQIDQFLNPARQDCAWLINAALH